MLSELKSLVLVGKLRDALDVPMLMVSYLLGTRPTALQTTRLRVDGRAIITNRYL